ncbi:hypothetical protein GH714_005220 [Hevea brasiliensis]|uniref:Ubiquitin-like domain-containing protein n=1 Tax=Hevea brasiliensis TaxID=3981 RepID=A0A6A6K9P2_HEVBR|nr:hypothetical protein GH714_005220 [Hevea brasiliensis]
MDLYLKIVKTVCLNLKGSETIKTLKALIHEKEGICEKNQDLFFDGNLLTDGQRLLDCGVRRNSTLHLIVQNSVAIKLFVKISSEQRIIMVEATACDTIHNIKLMIQSKQGILSDNFTLVHDGHLLEDERTLASLNIRSNSTIHLVFCQKEVLSIFVKAPDEENVTLRVKVMFTVDDVKAIFGSMVGISVSGWNLFYAGKQLEGSKTLAFYDIKEGSFLELLPTVMQIFVKTWIGKTLALDVQERDTVKYIKEKLVQKLQIPIDLQSIVYAGRRLENDRDLASYGIQRHSTLHMVLAPSSTVIKMPLTDIGFELPATTDICSLKSKIQRKFHAPVKEVLFKGKALHDDHTLAYYNIEKDGQLVVIL